MTQPSAASGVDAATIEQALDILCERHGELGVSELRAEGVNPDRFPETHSGLFDADHRGDMARAALTLTTGGKAKAVYWALNPVDRRLIARSANRTRKAAKGEAVADKDIARRVWLPIDCDPDRPSGISSSESEHSAALERCNDIRYCLGEEGWPEPIVADSGNGGHLYYAIDLPNDLESKMRVERCLKALHHRFSRDGVTVDTSLFNASRIIKTPGTWARKGDNTTERPHRVSQLIFIPDKRLIVPLELLDALAAQAPEVRPTVSYPKPSTNGAAAHASNGNGHAYDSTAWTPDQKANRFRKYAAKVPPAISGDKGQSRAFHVSRVAFEFGLDESQAVAELMALNENWQPPFEASDIERKVAEAYKKGGDFGCKLGPPPKRQRKPREKKPPAIPAVLPTPIDLDTVCAEYALTDTGNAERFRTRFGHLVRYCHSTKKWYVWDGRRFKLDDTGAVDRLMKDTSRSIYNEAACIKLADKAGDLGEHAISSESAVNRERAMKLARSEPGIPVTVSELDSHSMLLNCPNGIVDLRTQALIPHDQKYLLTKLCPTAYQPDAQAPAWESTLQSIFNGDDELIDFMRRVCGYFATGEIREQILTMYYGVGANGKSTFVNAILEALGQDFAGPVHEELLFESKHEQHPTALKALQGKRLGVTSETGDGWRMNEIRIKRLTGGNTITARGMYEDFSSFKPTHKLCVETNHKPQVRGTDHAMWRRIVLVPFTQVFWNPEKGETGPEPLRQDKELPSKLEAERAGILAWMVRGCMEWQRDGLMIPESVTAATKEYQSNQDVVGVFIGELCVVGNRGFEVKFSNLYHTYSQWCDAAGEHPTNQRRFGSALQERGYESFTRNGTWYRGIGLRSE